MQRLDLQNIQNYKLIKNIIKKTRKNIMTKLNVNRINGSGVKYALYVFLAIVALLFISSKGAYAAAFDAEAFASGIGKSIGKAVVGVMWLGLGVICTSALILTPGDFKVKGGASLGLGMLGGAGLAQIQDRFLSDEVLAAIDALPVLQGAVSVLC